MCLQQCGSRPILGGPTAALASADYGLSTGCAQVTAQGSRPRERWLRDPQLSLLVHVVSGASACWGMWWQLLQSCRWAWRVLPALLSHGCCLERGGFMGLTCVHLRLQIRARHSASPGLTGGVGGEGRGQRLRSRGLVLDWSFLRASVGSPYPHPGSGCAGWAALDRPPFRRGKATRLGGPSPPQHREAGRQGAQGPAGAPSTCGSGFCSGES